MRVACPHCNSQGNVKDKYAGWEALCPHCQQSYVLEPMQKPVKWFYALGKEKIGPLSEQEFSQLVSDGAILPDTLVWNKSLGNWQKFAELGGAGEVATGGQSCTACGQSYADKDMFDHYGQMVCSKCKLKLLHEKRDEEGLPVSGVTPEAATGYYANLGMRSLAKVIDFIILGMLGFSVEFIGDTFFGDLYVRTTLSAAFFTTLSVNMLVGVIYMTAFVGKFSATPGKIFCGMKIVSPEGKDIGYGRALYRYIGEFVVVALTLAIGYLFAFFDCERRTLHDRICRTRVVKAS